jgi:hypothetical protein
MTTEGCSTAVSNGSQNFQVLKTQPPAIRFQNPAPDDVGHLQMILDRKSITREVSVFLSLRNVPKDGYPDPHYLFLAVLRRSLKRHSCPVFTHLADSLRTHNPKVLPQRCFDILVMRRKVNWTLKAFCRN